MRPGLYVMFLLVSMCMMSSSPASGVRAELRAGKGLLIGSGAAAIQVSWGSNVVLSERDASHRAKGRCAFNIAYEVNNEGASASPPFKNFLLGRDKILAIDASTALAAGDKRAISTQPYLEPGTYVLSLQVDAEHPAGPAASEHITLTLVGHCAAS